MTSFNANLPAAQLFGLLGFRPQGLMRQLASIKQQAGLLNNLIDNFQRSAGGMTGAGVQQLAQQGSLPQSTLCCPPNQCACKCAGQYFKPQQIDFGTAPGVAPGTPQSLEHRARGMRLERFLSTNPFARHQLEGRLGGRIVNDGKFDGRITVQRQPGGLLGGRPVTGPAAPAMGALGGIQRGAAHAGLPSFGPNAFNNMMLGALANTLGGGGLLPGAGAPGGFPGAAPGGFPGAAPKRSAYRRPIGFDDILKQGRPGVPGGFPGMAPGGFPGAPAGGGMMGGAGGLPGGTPGAGQPAAPGGNPGAPMGMGMPGGVGNALNAPGLTVEDKVVMLLMQITKGFDKKIQDQANRLNQLQQQQGGGGKGGGGKGGGGGGDKSIDVESMKLKRLIDKRGQMFDMLRQIIDKYNETAKNMIQAVGR